MKKYEKILINQRTEIFTSLSAEKRSKLHEIVFSSPFSSEIFLRKTKIVNIYQIMIS